MKVTIYAFNKDNKLIATTDVDLWSDEQYDKFISQDNGMDLIVDASKSLGLNCEVYRTLVLHE